jgi:signal transduction histidine kinase
LRQLILLAFLIAAVWAFLGFFFASQEHAIAAARGYAEDGDERLLHTVPACVAWALLTPFVIGIADALPLRGERRGRNAVLLVVAGVAVAALRAVIDAATPALFAQPLSNEQFEATAIAVVHLHFLFFAVIAGVTNFVRARAEADERARREAMTDAALAEAQLRRLRGDLQPHFLFNTLHAVTALVHTDARAARETIERLMELLRASLDAATRTEVPLAEELDFVKRYLELQKVRFGERLQADVSVADPDLLRARVPPLVLQPLVENSVVHGIRRRAEGGRIAVHAFRDAGALRIEVRDSGPGCAPEAPFSGASIGVPATRARLDYLYRDPEALSFRRDGDDFVAGVRVPLRLA